jgi:hypothetical protein
MESHRVPLLQRNLRDNRHRLVRCSGMESHRVALLQKNLRDNHHRLARCAEKEKHWGLAAVSRWVAAY